MATATIKLMEALLETANQLEKGVNYQWGHMGSCNCGHLVQEITKLTAAQIHDYAMANCMGDWSEQSQMFCGTGSMPMDLLFSELMNAGLDMVDIKHLEKCSDPRVLQQMPEGKKYPKNNLKEDVVLYMETWANVLEEELIDKIVEY
jgi:sugar phosphate isomerase/epimerase